MLSKEKGRSTIRAVYIDNIRRLLGMRRIDSPECTDKEVVRSDEGSR